jgi:hypothetical protein
MTRSVSVWFLALLLIGLFLVGCSQGGNISSPSPNGGEEPVKEATAPDDGYTRYIWDIGEVVIDPEKQTVDIIRPRTADFNVNVLQFMQAPCPDSVNYVINWGASQPVNGLIDVDVTLTHPFPQNFYWGHDVRLIIMANGSQPGLYDSSIRYAQPTQLRMLDPDGYTRWWNKNEFWLLGNTIFEYHEGLKGIGNFTPSARINPYKYFGDSVAKNEYPPDIDEATRGEFRSGHSNSRHMILKFPKAFQVDFRFKYCVDASWYEPINTPVDSSDDFGLQANCREAYQIKVDQTGSTVYYKDPGDYGGDLHLNIEIFDWKQGGGTVEDEIARVVIESPTLINVPGGYIDITSIADKSPGSSDNSILFSYTVENCTPTGNDYQEVMITVEDANTTSYKPPPGVDTPYPNKPLAAFYLYTANVPSEPQEKSITVVIPNGGEEWFIGDQETIFWTSTGPIAQVKIEYSTDNGGTFPYEIVGATTNDGNHLWDPIPDTPTTQAIVRISEVGNPTMNDVSDDPFTIKEEEKTITVVEPNGGESLEIGGSFEIEWTSTGNIQNVLIEYSNDGGSSYVSPPITASTPDDGSFTWDPIPDDPTDQGLIKITDVDDAAIFDESDDVFEITTEPKVITVVSPNGGESWQIGSTHNITWLATGPITDVMIEYYKDDDYGTAVEIIASTENDGTFEWDPIPDDPTTTAKVRISDAAAPGTYDDSNDFFEITSEAPGWNKTIDGYALSPQPNQGANEPDICVKNFGDPDYSRGQVAEQSGQELSFNMYSDDYTTVVGHYTLATSVDYDLSDWNRFDAVIYWANVLGLSNSCDTSPFPGHWFNDPGHTALICCYNADESDPDAGLNFGFWLYGDGDPDQDIPPDNDPDDMAWLHDCDWDSGLLGGPNDDPELDDTWIYTTMTYSEHPDQPGVNQDSSMFICYTDTYNGDGSVALILPEMVLGGVFPGYIDDSDPDIMRLAVDNNTGLGAGGGIYPITTWYVMGASHKVHIFFIWYNTDDMGYYYSPFDEEYLGEGGALGIDFGGEAVDICMLPAMIFEYDDWNWLAVLVDTGAGWYIKVYLLDFIGPDPDNPELVVTEVHTTDVCTGTPVSMDADNYDFELHVLADDGGTYKVTVWQYTED